MQKNVLQKLILKIRIQDPDPEPDQKKIENAGSGSVGIKCVRIRNTANDYNLTTVR